MKTLEDQEFAKVRAKLDKALTSVFTEDGKRAVLFYMLQRYSLNLEQASSDPVRLEAALTNMLGDIGWLVVKRKILEQFWGRSVGIEEPAVHGASLRDAFGLAGGLARNLVSLKGPA